MKFGEYLIKEKIVSEEDLESALRTQRYQSIRIGRLLRNLGLISQKNLNESLLNFKGIERIGTVDRVLKDIRASQFSAPQKVWAIRNQCLLTKTDGKKITVLTEEFRDEIVEEAEKDLGNEVEVILVDPETLKFLQKEVGSDYTATKPFISLVRPLNDDEKIAETDPYTQLFRDVILEAKRTNASDIHIQPTRDGVDIRLRICGDMKLWKELGDTHRHSFINEVKRLTNLAIAVSGRAQDGRVSFKNWKLDVRASLLPSQYGEKIVLRLLDLTRKFDLDEMEFNPETKEDLKKALGEKNGVVIISGPTGSGKTTTLYTLLSYLDRSKNNIITLEDPIEYGIDGLTQVQVSSKLKFSDALRAVLRQDPDIILVGEVRDPETADLCTKAALTGHLVLSTLHANNAEQVVSRLLNLGVDPFSLKSSLRFSAAQRLLKKLCPKCAKPISEQENKGLYEKIKRISPEANLRNLNVRNLKGCDNCFEGVIGRVPILEYLKANEISDLLKMEKTAKAVSTTSLRNQAIKLAEKGEVDAFEAIEIG